MYVTGEASRLDGTAVGSALGIGRLRPITELTCAFSLRPESARSGFAGGSSTAALELNQKNLLQYFATIF